MLDGRRVLRHHRMVSRDLLNQVQDVDFNYGVTHPDGREERLAHKAQKRYLLRFEAEQLLARSGSEVGQCTRIMTKAPGSKYPGELIWVAGKTTLANPRRTLDHWFPEED